MGALGGCRALVSDSLFASSHAAAMVRVGGSGKHPSHPQPKLETPP